MARFIGGLGAAIDTAGALCILLGVTIPAWFAVAALGTKWAFWDWETGLTAMTHVWGSRLLIAGLVLAVLTAILILTHRQVSGRGRGNWPGVILVALLASGGLGWAWHVERDKLGQVPVLDVTTDFADPPHFSAAFVGRRSPLDAPLDYAGKTASDGQALPALQLSQYPGVQTLHLETSPEQAYRRGLETARELGWRVTTASSDAGMFEASSESLWFGFRDDMVVRVRSTDNGGTIIDVRSLARQPVHDLGRNARRIERFLGAVAAG